MRASNGPETRCNASLWQGRATPSQHPISKQKPGPGPGLIADKCAGRSGGGLVEFRGVGLDRLDGFARNLLRQFAQFLGLRGERLDLLAGVGAPQFKGLGRRLRAEQFLGEVQCRGGVGLHEFHHLGGVRARALAGGGEYGLHGAVVGLGGILELGVVVAGLRNTPLGEGTHLLGHFERDNGSGKRIVSHGHGSFTSGLEWNDPLARPSRKGLRTSTSITQWGYPHRVSGPYTRIMSFLCIANRFWLQCHISGISQIGGKSGPLTVPKGPWTS